LRGKHFFCGIFCMGSLGFTGDWSHFFAPFNAGEKKLKKD
jgi:hypothetical protein